MEELLKLIESIKAAAQTEIEAAYAKGFADGKASIDVPATPVGEKIYSQEEFDQLVEPMRSKLVELQAQVDAIPAKIAEEVSSFKASLLKQYEELQVIETQAETGFKDLLA